MRENRPYGSEGGAGFIPCPYPYPGSRPHSEMRPKEPSRPNSLCQLATTH